MQSQREGVRAEWGSMKDFVPFQRSGDLDLQVRTLLRAMLEPIDLYGREELLAQIPAVSVIGRSALDCLLEVNRGTPRSPISSKEPVVWAPVEARPEDVEMARMRAVYYRGATGAQPVDDFVEQLPPHVQAALDLQIERLKMLGPTDPPLSFPHSSQVEGELRELRCHYGNRLFQMLYRRSRQLFVLLPIFEKRSRIVPEADKAARRGRHSQRRTK
jgi:phage-related protein